MSGYENAAYFYARVMTPLVARKTYQLVSKISSKQRCTLLARVRARGRRTHARDVSASESSGSDSKMTPALYPLGPQNELSKIRWCYYLL
jgi:hypothetical protein